MSTPRPSKKIRISPNLLSAVENLLRTEGALLAREVQVGVGYSRVHVNRALNALVDLGEARTSTVMVAGDCPARLYWLARRDTGLWP